MDVDDEDGEEVEGVILRDHHSGGQGPWLAGREEQEEREINLGELREAL